LRIRKRSRHAVFEFDRVGCAHCGATHATGFPFRPRTLCLLRSLSHAIRLRHAN
jgi:hypothetical protein